jgi:predicted aspartyl protease
VYYHEYKRPEGKCSYLWAGIEGKSMKGMLMLVDTGATISILPLKIYEELKDDQKGELEPTNMVIRTGTNGKVDVRGTAKVQFDLEGRKFNYPFYICGDARNPIIGFDFQAKYDMYLRPGENALYIGYRKLACFDHKKLWNKASNYVPAIYNRATK